MSMPYVEHQDAEVRRRSAVLAAKTILPLDLYCQHKRELLEVCIWKITEADGKYKTRYRSRAAMKLSPSKLHHEHVFRMRLLIDALILSPEHADVILNRAAACTVTREEHRALSLCDRLNPQIDGWARYSRAGIEVIDTASGSMIEYAADVLEARSKVQLAPPQ